MRITRRKELESGISFQASMLDKIQADFQGIYLRCILSCKLHGETRAAGSKHTGEHTFPCTADTAHILTQKRAWGIKFLLADLWTLWHVCIVGCAIQTAVWTATLRSIEATKTGRKKLACFFKHA